VRALICASGTIGDVHPLVGIAYAMRARGHEVFLLANPAYEKLASEAGVEFEAVGRREDLDKIRSNPKVWTYRHGWKVWTKGAGVGPMQELFRAIQKLNREHETIVAASYLCFGARAAREKLGIPTATIHLNVHTIRTVYDLFAFPPPAFAPDWIPYSYLTNQRFPLWYRKFNLWVADHFFIDPVLRKKIVRFRHELGLPRLRSCVREWWNSPDLNIGLYPDWWAGHHPDWPTTVVTTGFPFWDRSQSETISDDLQRSFDDAGKLIVFTPGASDSHSEAHFAAFARACAALGYRGIILTSHEPTAAADTVRFERYVPFRKLLPYAAAVIHHAGIGTSAHCLAAGVPQVVVPTLYNTPDTAIRLERLDVSRQISPGRFSERRLTQTLDEVLNSPEIAASCTKYADRMSGIDPLPNICQELESLL